MGRLGRHAGEFFRLDSGANTGQNVSSLKVGGGPRRGG